MSTNNITPEQRENSLDRIVEEANAGNPEMCSLLFSKYEHGFGVPKNFELAYKWLQRAAELGDVWSIYNLGLVQESGRLNNKVDRQKAFDLFKSAFSKDFPNAAEKLAEYYENGIGVDVDVDEAFKLWKVLADSGDSWAQLHLSRMLMLGRGCELNVQLADMYVQKALKGFGETAEIVKVAMNSANSGYKPAMEFLGLAHLHGWFGCQVDKKMSNRWLNAADFKGQIK